MTSDRRKLSRVPVFFLLGEVNLSAQEYQEECRGVVKNITPDGLLLETNIELKKNDVLQLTFTLPNIERTLNLESRICWVESKKSWSKAGLEFLDMSVDQREIIMEYLLTLGIPV